MGFDAFKTPKKNHDFKKIIFISFIFLVWIILEKLGKLWCNFHRENSEGCLLFAIKFDVFEKVILGMWLTFRYGLANWFNYYAEGELVFGDNVLNVPFLY